MYNGETKYWSKSISCPSADLPDLGETTSNQWPRDKTYGILKGEQYSPEKENRWTDEESNGALKRKFGYPFTSPAADGKTSICLTLGTIRNKSGFILLADSSKIKTATGWAKAYNSSNIVIHNTVSGIWAAHNNRANIAYIDGHAATQDGGTLHQKSGVMSILKQDRSGRDTF